MAPFTYSSGSTILEKRIDLGEVEYESNKGVLGQTSQDSIFLIEGNRSGFFKIKICSEPRNKDEEDEYISEHPLAGAESLISNEIGKIYLSVSYVSLINGKLVRDEVLIGDENNISKNIECIVNDMKSPDLFGDWPEF